jgi:soluble lytic murein transglycosylase
VALLVLQAAGARGTPMTRDGSGVAPREPTLHGPPVESWIAGELLAYQTGLAHFEVERLARAIEEESTRTGIHRDMILAVMRTESGFFNWARSRVGALGLMQVMPATGETVARQLGIEWKGSRTLFDPVANVRIGVGYLAKLRSRYGSWERTLAAYNWGPRAIDRRLQRGSALPVRYPSAVLTALHSPTAP